MRMKSSCDSIEGKPNDLDTKPMLSGPPWRCQIGLDGMPCRQ